MIKKAHENNRLVEPRGVKHKKNTSIDLLMRARTSALGD